jgi:crotonobetainyl-CoA:carnitine CoA-transferase CaiB-like acyl-CoA transferase
LFARVDLAKLETDDALVNGLTFRKKRVSAPNDALAGVRILDLTKVLAGPLCTQYLSDLGADIIKVEPTGSGDETRRWPPFRGGQGAVFLSANRNKRSIAVDLKTESGRAVVHRLAASADVFIESYGTGVVERLGVGYDTIRAIKPDIVYCSISGFGRSGALKNGLGYDVILQAYSGMMGMTGEKGSGPVRIPISPIDQMTGLHAMSGILAALISRQKTRTGTCIEVSLYESALALLGYSLQIYWEKGVLPEKNGSGHESLCPYQAFDASDKPMLLGIANDNLWRRFCSVANLSGAVDDPRFATNPARVANFGATIALVQGVLRTRSCDDWVATLIAAGIPCAPINTLQDALDNPHTADRGIVLDYEHPELGVLKTIAHPVTFDGAKSAVRSPPPLLGAHSDEILREIGFDDAEIGRLKAAGAIA